MKNRSEEYLPRVAKSNAMDTAYMRFFNSYQHQNWFDSIVDLTISLESLFSPDENQELKHRISLRAGWLLNRNNRSDDTLNSENKIYNLVRTMYDIRSSRVHGGIPKQSDIRKWLKILSGVDYDDSSEFEIPQLAMESARDIVRKAIAACSRLSKLKGGGPQWPFPERFDENLVIDYQRKVWQKAAGI